jgi:hypothetical protein
VIDWLTPFVLLVEWIFIAVRPDVAITSPVNVDATHLDIARELRLVIEDEHTSGALLVAFLEIHAAPQW